MGLAMPLSSPSLKRSAHPSDFSTSASKKPTHHIHQHRHLKHSTEGVINSKAFDQNEEGADAALVRSIALALQAVGFDRAEPAAIEALQHDAEEYITHFLSHVRQCMLASRRSRTIPEDFLQALHFNNLSLRALLPHIDPPVPASKSQRQFPFDDDDDDAEPAFTTGSSQTIFQMQQEDTQAKYIPAHLPPLPSKHSYRETIELPTRERDPKKIRELATEEGRMGEEALRRLLSGVKSMGNQHRGSMTSNDGDKKGKKGYMSERQRLKAQRREIWEEAMQLRSFDERGNANKDGDAMEIDMGGGDHDHDHDHDGLGGESKELLKESAHISTAVNYEKRYWRKVPSQRAGEMNGISNGV